MDFTSINILDILPQKSPFLFIDGIEEFVSGEKFIAFKNITADDPILLENEEGVLRFPESLMIEAAAQAVLLFAKLIQADQADHNGLFVLGKVNSEFFRQVFVGDTLKLDVKQMRLLAQGGYADVEIKVHEDLIGKAELFFLLFKGE